MERTAEKPWVRSDRRWLAAFLAAAAVLAVILGLNVALSELRPGSAWGLAYGTAAALLLTAAGLHAVRRRTMRLSSRAGLGRSRTWLQVHLYGGLAFLLLVLMHSGFGLPTGWVTGWLWGLSWWTAASGAVGLGLEKWIPRVLTSGLSTEVLYERIPDLVREVRERAETVAREGAEPIRDLYDRRLAGDFAAPQRRPVYLLDITGGIRSRLREFEVLRRLLPEDEQRRLAELEDLFETKLEIDAHYTLQPLLRWWLFAHGPVSLLLFGFLALHLYAVLVY